MEIGSVEERLVYKAEHLLMQECVCLTLAIENLKNQHQVELQPLTTRLNFLGSIHDQLRVLRLGPLP